MSKLLDLIHNKQKKLQEAKNRLNTIKPKQGTNRYRLLPSWRGDGEEFWHDYGAHWVKDAAGDMKGVFTCQYATFGQKCPVCEAMAKLKKSTDEVTAKIIDQARVSRRVLLNVLEVHGDKPTEPQILEIPNSVFEDLLNLLAQWGEKLIQLNQGYDFTITRSGSGFNTSYTVAPCPEATDVNPRVLEKLHDLDKAVQTNLDATNALAGLSEIAGILPSVSKPTLTAIPQERPAIASSVVSPEPVAAKAPAEPAQSAPTIGEIKIDEISEGMSDAQLEAFISDL